MNSKKEDYTRKEWEERKDDVCIFIMGSGKIDKVVRSICQTQSIVQSREVSIIGKLYPYINYTGDISGV